MCEQQPIARYSCSELEKKTEVFKALAHPTRLYICEQLGNGERCVCEFVDAVAADFSTVSKHLTVLRKAGIIETEKRGKHVYYRLKARCVLGFVTCLDDMLNGTACPEERPVLSGKRRRQQ